MTNSKYDFIKDLLKEKKVNQSQRERIFKLVSQEVSLEGNLEERVKKIEEILNITIQKSSTSNTNKAQKLNQKYIDPFKLYRFLFEYNQNPILRYTCHDIDSDAIETIIEKCGTQTYDFKKHVEIIINEFEKHIKQYFAPKVVPLIRGYLTGKDYQGKTLEKGWSADNLMINWSSPELLVWVQSNPDIPPNLNENIAGDREVELYPIDPQVNSIISNEPIQNFTQVVLHFKNLFHIKSGGQSLRSILSRVNLDKKWGDKVDFEIDDKCFPENLEHFTDIDKLIQTYNKLLHLIYEHKLDEEKPIVRLSFYEEKEKVILSIHHLNGRYRKTIQNTLERPGEQFNLMVKKQINGLCNLRVRADFGSEGSAEINLWDGEERKSIELKDFKGVEHLLEFPKTKKKS
jgi:hypothetical protein